MGTKISSIGCPAGMSGLAVEPWSKGEIYAVAADWAQANSPVLVYGEDGWTYDEHGRQVAEISHRARSALESVIREAIAMGGDEPDDDEVDSILDAAVEVWTEDVVAMVATLERHGDRFTGNCTEDAAGDWIGNSFGAAAADDWCEIGCWDASTAAELRDAGLTPWQAHDAAERLTEDLEDAAKVYTDGDPIYSACNGDTPFQKIIDAAD